MEEIVFKSLVNKDFADDFNARRLEIEKAEAACAADAVELENVFQTETVNFTETMETSKVLINDKIAAIYKQSEDNAKAALESFQREINACQSRMDEAKASLDAQIKACEDKKQREQRANEKTNADIEKKYKADIAAEDKRYAAVVKKREKETALRNADAKKEEAALRSEFDKRVAEIKVTMTSHQDRFKTLEKDIKAEFEAVKTKNEQKIEEKRKEFADLQNELNGEIQNCTEKQRLKVLKSQLAAGKSSCDTAVNGFKNEISIAQKVYDVKYKDSFAQLVHELTGLQNQMRNLAAEFAFDKSELSYDCRIADAEDENRALAEAREHEEKVSEIELWRKDELNKEYSRAFCANYDLDMEQKTAQCNYDVIVEEENNNIELQKLTLEANCKVIELDRATAIADQNKMMTQDEAKTDTQIKTGRERFLHAKQTNDIDIYSLALKSANKSEKLMNKQKLQRVEANINAQIAKVKARLAEDLANIKVLKDYQAEEYAAMVSANAAFYAKQREVAQKLLDEGKEKNSDAEVKIFTTALANVEANFQQSEESLKSQANVTDAMIATEEARIREQAQKELEALELFLKEYADLTEKQNTASDDLTSRADEQKKDTVVDLYASFESNVSVHENDCLAASEAAEAAQVALRKANIVAKETFVQETDDKKIQAQKECGQRQEEIRARLQQYVNEAEKNKSISKGMLGEQLYKSLEVRQDRKTDNAKLATQKSNELKTFSGACRRAVADARKDCERKCNDNDKLRAKEERWLLKNGKVSSGKEWWVVDFNE